MIDSLIASDGESIEHMQERHTKVFPDLTVPG